MFWTRNSSGSTSATDMTSASNVLLSASSRSMGFFASLDVLGTSDAAAKPNQSAGENAREVVDPLDAVSNQDQENDRENDALAMPPSFVLSEQRRSELLKAARANRTSWVDSTTSTASSTMTSMPWSQDQGAKISAKCQEALDQISMEMQTLTSSLAALRRKIIPTDVLSTEPEDEIGNETHGGDPQGATGGVRTIAEELRVKQAELESWQRVHLTQGKLSAMQRKRLTASDREMLFLLAFQELLTILKHPLAAEVVYQIQTFVKKVETWNLEAMLRHRALQDRPGGHVQAFIDKLVQQLQRTGSGLFAAANAEILSLEDDEEQLLHEVLEAFLLEKLYAKALTPSTKAEDEDNALYERLESLRFVEFRHLDLPIPHNPETQQRWEQLIDQLGEISVFPSPRRKMDCVMRVCQDLTTLLASLHATHKFPSADEFLPGLIYLLLKANPAKLKRSVHFILEYRRPSRLVSEPGYFFTHLVSSVAFLEQVNGELLTITPEEFERGMRESRKRVQTHQPSQPPSVREAKPQPQEETPRENQTPVLELRLPTVLEVRAKRLATCS